MHELLKNTYKHKALAFMALPGIIAILLFWGLPLFGIVIAFKNYNYQLGILGSKWVGFDNFKFLFARGTVMKELLRNTVGYYLLFTALGTLCNVVLALVLNECSRKYFVKVSHTIMIFPTFISYVAVTFIVHALLDPSSGLANQLLQMFGVSPISWYTEGKYWPIIFCIITVWKNTGYGCILYLSALAGMDQEIFESARIDGASRLKQIWYISLPQLVSMISILLLLGLGGIMSSSTGLFYMVTKNSALLYPYTQTIDAYVFNSLMSSGNDLSILGAVSFFQMFVGSTIVIIVNYIVRRLEPANAIF